MITKNLKYPKHALENSYTGSVEVLFKINDEGKIVVKTMSTENEEIAKSVTAQLENICCKDIKTPFNQYYRVTISFKLIG